MCTRWLVCALLLAATSCAALPASAAAADPSSNFAVAPSCTDGAACITQAVRVLDDARARLGQPPYTLPGDFTSLDPAEQAFVLTDLDRVAEGLRPIPALTGELDNAAAAGVISDTDPVVSGQDILIRTSDWAGGYRNMPFAYEAWMYDDGPGWAHRHTILWPFGATGPLAMGAAAGTDLTGTGSFTMVLVQGSSSYQPVYLYTWRQALAAGAGGGIGGSAPVRQAALPARPFEIVDLIVSGHALRFQLAEAQRIRLTCALLRANGGRGSRRRVRVCGAHTRYRGLSRGRYRLIVRGAGRTLARYVRVRA